MRYTREYWDDVEQAVCSIPVIERLYGRSFFITGVTGMICSSVADVLLYLNRKHGAGITVIAAGRNEKATFERFEGFGEKDGLRFSFFDATAHDPIKLTYGADYLIHGASNAHPSIYLKEPVETIEANVTGLRRILDLAARTHSRRVMYVSSSEVYGRKEGNTPYAEGDYGYLDILNVRACYPSAKRLAETLCVAYGLEYGVDSVMVRPGYIYGPTIRPSDNRASAEFSRQAASGHDIVMKSRGEQLRSYCYTLDCASAMLTVLLNGARGQAYNISNPHSICSICDIACALAQAGGVKVVFDLPTEAERRTYSLMDNSSLASEKLEALGWVPQFSLAKGVRTTIDMLRAEMRAE